jgi:hypothetical protein
MKVRLTRKFAEAINGVNLSRHAAGDVLDLPSPDTRVLIAEGWAVAVDESEEDPGSKAAERPPRTPDKKR